MQVSGLDGERGRNRTFNLLIKSHFPQIVEFMGIGCFHVVDSEYFALCLAI